MKMYDATTMFDAKEMLVANTFCGATQFSMERNCVVPKQPQTCLLKEVLDAKNVFEAKNSLMQRNCLMN